MGGFFVKPSSPMGFELTYSEDDRFSYVGLDGWHEDFESKSEAQRCFFSALTSSIRLKVEIKRDFEYKWTCEAFIDNAWEDFGTVGLLFYPYWKKTDVVFRTNGWIDAL